LIAALTVRSMGSGAGWPTPSFPPCLEKVTFLTRRF
jgi:hypothetical protein